MNVDDNGSVAKASVQTWLAFFFKWQDKYENKEGSTIFKKTPP